MNKYGALYVGFLVIVLLMLICALWLDRGENDVNKNENRDR